MLHNVPGFRKKQTRYHLYMKSTFCQRKKEGGVFRRSGSDDYFQWYTHPWWGTFTHIHIFFFFWKWQNNFLCFVNLFTFQIPTATIARTSSWNLSCERRRRNLWTDRPGVWMTSLPCERKRTPMWPIRWSSWKTSFATCPCWKVANPRISWNVSSRVYCEFSIYTDRYI